MATLGFVALNLASLGVATTMIVLGCITAANPSALYNPDNVMTSPDVLLRHVDVLSRDKSSHILVSVATALIVVGLVIVGLVCLGKVGIHRRNAYLIILFAVLSLVLTVSSVSVAVYLHMLAEGMLSKLRSSLFLSIDRDYVFGLRVRNGSVSMSEDEFEQTWDVLQMTSPCCGVTKSRDWEEGARWNRTYTGLDGTVIEGVMKPMSCCVNSSYAELGSHDSDHVTGCMLTAESDRPGCEQIVFTVIKKVQLVAGSCFLAHVLLQGFSVLAACCIRTVTTKNNNVRPV